MLLLGQRQRQRLLGQDVVDEPRRRGRPSLGDAERGERLIQALHSLLCDDEQGPWIGGQGLADGPAQFNGARRHHDDVRHLGRHGRGRVLVRRRQHQDPERVVASPPPRGCLRVALRGLARERAQKVSCLLRAQAVERHAARQAQAGDVLLALRAEPLELEDGTLLGLHTLERRRLGPAHRAHWALAGVGVLATAAPLVRDNSRRHAIHGAPPLLKHRGPHGFGGRGELTRRRYCA
mmetsp:Transcript_79671/g.172181  ORF Transcript_79671/g.172181 Transcript_79671/m.172181 type:complete len:236 (-) Transcript_79671:8-715(-)